jgi:hypothetical protein
MEVVVAISETHVRLSTGARRWLSWLADPTPAGESPRSNIKATELSSLLDAAELHGVLATCLANLKLPQAARCGTAGDAANQRASVITTKSRRLVERLGVQMLLAHHGKAVRQSLAEQKLPFLLVKGQTFAERLYPNPTFRGYTDIDLLIPVDVRPAVSDVLQRHGFALQSMSYRKGDDYFEDKWIQYVERQEVMIEVHCDLVHNPRLRRDFSLRYEDVFDAGAGDGSDPTALLLVAAAHGSASHQFDRLQHVVDVLQIARGVAGPVDVKHLRDVSDRCGLTFAIVAALSLAARMFDDPSCRSLLEELAPQTFDRAASRLLSPALVIGAQSRQRSLASWRRKIFRQALRGAARRSVQSPEL